MTIAERFLAGVYLASGSFWLLWLHKKLLAYLGIVALIYFFIQLFMYNMPMFGFVGEELSVLITLQGLHYTLEVTNWLYYVVLFFVTFLYFFVLTFFNIGLIKHTLAIVHGNTSIHVRSVLNSCLTLWRTILTWSALLTVISILLHLTAVSAGWLHRFLTPFGLIVVFLLMLAWSLITFLVLPVIAAEQTGVGKAIKRSAMLVAIVLIEIIGAQCWILLISFLGLAPMIMIMRALSSKVSLSLLFVLMTWVVVLACYIVLSALTVIRALLYERSAQLVNLLKLKWWQ